MPMKHQRGHSFITDDQAEQMGADMAIQVHAHDFILGRDGDGG